MELNREVRGEKKRRESFSARAVEREEEQGVRGWEKVRPCAGWRRKNVVVKV